MASEKEAMTVATETPAPSTVRDPKDVEENKDLAALSYAWIVSIILLFSKRHSPFVHFHAKQGVILFVLSILFWFVPIVSRVLELVVFLFCAWGFLAAAQGKWVELPFVGQLAKGKLSLRGSWKELVRAVLDAKKWLVHLWKHHDEVEMRDTFREESTATAAPTENDSPETARVADDTAPTPEFQDFPPLDRP